MVLGKINKKLKDIGLASIVAGSMLFGSSQDNGIASDSARYASNNVKYASNSVKHNLVNYTKKKKKANWKEEDITIRKGRISMPKGYDVEEANVINQYVLNLTHDIPGAGEVNKYITPDANYCLVHIRQMHAAIGPIEFIEQEDKYKVKHIQKIQDEIYDIFSYFIKNNLMGETREEIYLEGFSFESLMSLENNKENTERYRAIWNDTTEVENYEDHPLYKHIIPEDKEHFIHLFNIFKDQKMKNRVSGIQKAYFDHDLDDFRIHPGEKNNEVYSKEYLDANRYTREYRKNDNPTEEDNKKMEEVIKFLERDNNLMKKGVDDREDFILESVVKNHDPIGIVVYGGAHAWGGRDSFGKNYSLDGRMSYRDNIAEWNKKNPDKKFSLIEIIPKTYLNFRDHRDFMLKDLELMKSTMDLLKHGLKLGESDREEPK